MNSNHARGILTPAQPRKIRPRLVVLLIALISISVYAHAQSPRKMDARTSLLIIDVQEFYFPGGAIPLDGPEAASRNVARLLEKFRAENRMVVHVGHNVSKEPAYYTDVIPRD